MTTELAELLADEFLIKDYTWKAGPNEDFVPEAEHIQAMLDRCVQRLYDGNIDNAGAIEIGRLYVKKSDDDANKVDVYMWMGEIDATG
jgi:hypothetical protein